MLKQPAGANLQYTMRGRRDCWRLPRIVELKDEPERHLDLAPWERAGEGAEAVRRAIAVGRHEVGLVQDVKCFRPEFDPASFGYPKILVQSEVELQEFRRTDDIPASISERLRRVCRNYDSVLVEVIRRTALCFRRERVAGDIRPVVRRAAHLQLAGRRIG